MFPVEDGGPGGVRGARRTSWDKSLPFCRNCIRVSPGPGGGRWDAGEAPSSAFLGIAEGLTQKRPYFSRVLSGFLSLCRLSTGLSPRRTARGGETEARTCRSGRLPLFSSGEGSLAEEPASVRRGGDAGRAAGKGPSRPEGARGAPGERAGAWLLPGEGLPRPPSERQLLTGRTLLGACQPGLGLPAGGCFGTTGPGLARASVLEKAAASQP